MRRLCKSWTGLDEITERHDIARRPPKAASHEYLLSRVFGDEPTVPQYLRHLNSIRRGDESAAAAPAMGRAIKHKGIKARCRKKRELRPISLKQVLMVFIDRNIELEKPYETLPTRTVTEEVRVGTVSGG